MNIKNNSEGGLTTPLFLCYQGVRNKQRENIMTSVYFKSSFAHLTRKEWVEVLVTDNQEQIDAKVAEMQAKGMTVRTESV